MKKFLVVLLSMMLAVALFAGCSSTPADTTATEGASEATEATEATEVPADPTEEPTEAPTAEPTEEPEPTAVPFNDPYKTEIVDWDEVGAPAHSFDTIFFNGQIITDGGVATWKVDNDETVDGTDGSITEVSMRGWCGFTEAAIVNAGYQIDENPLVWDADWAQQTEPAVLAAGGEYATRLQVDIPVSSLVGAGHELKLVCELESGEICYMNTFMLYYDGPAEGAANTVDGAIETSEYKASYVIDSSNAQTWTNGDIGTASYTYYINLKADGLYVGVNCVGAAAGDMVQLNFNPGARIDETPGLFLTVVLGDSLKVMQHNHKTALLEDDNAGGADITDKVENAVVKTDDGFAFEIKLPVEFFKVLDVENAADFEYGKENLYFGMFLVVGGNGYTNQSTAPGNDWTCKGLGLHEYIAY